MNQPALESTRRRTRTDSVFTLAVLVLFNSACSDTASTQTPPDTAVGTGGASDGTMSTGGTSPAGTGGIATSATGGTASGGMANDGPVPIGDGWVEYFPEWSYHVPPNADAYGERYTYDEEAGVFHLWVRVDDLSSFPGNDSGPRSEVRVRNDYPSGNRQFQADVMVMTGAERVGIWQVFQRPYPWMIRVYDGEFKEWGTGSTFATVPFGVYQRFHTIHHSATRKLQIYLDGELVLDTTISESDGSVDFYNKFGVYGREGMGELNEIYFKNVHYFQKD